MKKKYSPAVPEFPAICSILRGMRDFSILSVSFFLFLTNLFLLAVPLSGQSEPVLEEEIKPLWRYSAGGKVLGNIARGRDGNIYLVSESRGLHSIDPKTGKRLWLFRPGVAKLRQFVVTSPDGTVYFFTEDNTLYGINAGARVRWRLEVNGKPMFYPMCNTRGDILLFTGDKEITCYSRYGKTRWSFSLDDPPLFGGLSNSLGEACFLDRSKNLYILSEDGNLISRRAIEDDITQMMLRPDGEIVLSTTGGDLLILSDRGEEKKRIKAGFESSVTALRTGPENSVVAILFNGDVFRIEGEAVQKTGEIRGLGVGISLSENGETVTSDSSGNLYIGSLPPYRVTGEGSLSYPLLTEENIVVVGSSDWVVTAYPAESAGPGFSQFRANGARNGICRDFGSVFESERRKYRDHILYRNSRMIIESGDLTEISLMLEEMGRAQKQGRLQKDFPCYKVILYDLLYETSRSENDPVDRYRYIRMLTYRLIGELDDIRFRGIVLQSVRSENDEAAFMAGMSVLKIIAVDFDGAVLDMLNEKIREISPKSDLLILETAKTTSYILRYNGLFNKKSGFQIYRYLLNLPMSSRTKRELRSVIRNR